jgi:glycosyltransferase involved in cell wall biosynthesis
MTLPQPTVSVVIPAYNRAGVLPRSIGSVLAQTYNDFEVVVVDDASSDRTCETVAGLAEQDPRVRLVAARQNGGAARARNLGVQEARGRFIAFLDSDDWWMPGKLSAQVAALTACANPERTLSSHAYHVDDEMAPRIWPRRGPNPGEPLSEYMFVANGNLQTSTWMLSRELALAFPFAPELRRHEDWDVLLLLAAAGAAFLFVPEALGHRVCVSAPDRLSEITDAENSRDFMEQRRALFTAPARAAFGARTVSSQLYRYGRRVEALGLVWRAMRERAVPLAESVKIALRMIFPAVHAGLVRMKEAGGVR